MDKQAAPPEQEHRQLLVSIEQTVDLLGGVSRSKVYEYLRSGALKSVSIGRRRMVRADDLRQFVDSLAS